MRKSIRTRLTAAFVSLATIPLVILAGALALHSFYNHSARALAIEDAVAQRVAGEVSAFLREMERDLRQATLLQDFDNMSLERQRSTLLNLQLFKPTFQEVALLDSQGREQARVSLREVVTPADLGDRALANEFLIPVTSGQTYFSEVTFDGETGQPSMIISVPRVSPLDGSIQGVLLARADLKDVWDLIGEIPTQHDSMAYLVDNDGRVIAHPNPSVVLSGTTFAPPGTSGIHRGLDGSLTLMTTEHVPLEGESLLVVTEWELVSALTPTIRTVIIIGALLVAAVAAAALLGAWTVARITRPIEALASHARAIAQGDLSQTAEVKGGGEVADLAMAFNTMSDRVKDMVDTLEQRVAERTQELVKVNDDLEREIAERKRAEEMLRMREHETRALLDKNPDVISRVDRHMRHLYVNPAIEQATGLPPSAFIGKTHAEVGTPASLSDARRDVLMRVFETGMEATQEFEYPTPSGLRRFHSRIVPEFGPDGTVQSVLGIARDITEVKLVEEALRESEERYRSLVEIAPDAIYIRSDDEKWEFLYANPAAAKFFGAGSPQEMIGRSVLDYLYPSQHSEIDALFRQIRKEQAGRYRMENTMIRLDGRVVVFESTTVPLMFKGKSARHVFVNDITGSRRREEELRRRESEMKALVENNPDNVVRFDRELHYVYVNPAFERAAGRRADEVIGKTLQEVFRGLGAAESAVTTWVDTVRRVFETGQDGSIEYERRGPNGSRFFQSRIVPEFGDDGEPLYVLSIGRDITERALAEKRVKESEENEKRYARENEIIAEIGRIVSSSLEMTEVYDRFADGVRMLIPADRIVVNLTDIERGEAVKTYVNGIPAPGWDVGWTYRIAGTIEEVVISTKRPLLESGNDVRQLAEKYSGLEPAVRSGIRSFIIIPLVSEGRVIAVWWLSSVKANTYTERDLALAERIGGRLASAMSNAQLYAQRKQAEEDLKIRARQQAVVVQLGQQALESMELDRLMQDAVEAVASTLNVEYCKMLELLPERNELLLRAGVGWKEGLVGYATVGTERASQAGYALLTDEPVIVDDLRTETRFDDPSLLTEHNVVSGVSVIIRGSEAPFGVLGAHTTKSRIFTQDDVNFFQAVANIISAAIERKQGDEDLERRSQELARSNAELEQFAYVASHDLQEPLRAISGFTRILSRRYAGKLDTEADDFMQRIVGAASRMQGLIQDLLMYSRVGRNFAPLQMVDSHAVLEQELESLQGAVSSAQAKVTYDRLPKLAADPSLLRPIFRNLIANAVKFRKEDTPPQVHISAARKGDEWVFSVWDNGIGIEPNHTERIFIIFQRLHSRDKYEGTGIGLAICKKAVERLGGRIWVESEPGEGSVFYFTIPVLDVNIAAQDDADSKPGLPTEPPDVEQSGSTKEAPRSGDSVRKRARQLI